MNTFNSCVDHICRDLHLGLESWDMKYSPGRQTLQVPFPIILLTGISHNRPEIEYKCNTYNCMHIALACAKANACIVVNVIFFSLCRHQSACMNIPVETKISSETLMKTQFTRRLNRT